MALRTVAVARPVGVALPTRRVVTARAAARNEVEATFAKAATAAAAATTLLSAGNAVAAQAALSDVAAADGRAGILASLALPALGWVAFNMAEPVKNQLDAMSAKRAKAGVAAGLGLAAAMAVAGKADAATVAAGDLAAGDGRLGIILTLFLPVLGWVAFNMLGPVKNQLDAMAAKKSGGSKRRAAVGAGLGLTAAGLVGASSADAAELIGDVAAGDGRLGIILALFVPVLGWVAFNMLGPVLNQLDAMAAKKGGASSGGARRARAAAGAGLGLTAASMLGASSADAAELIGDVAAGDGRLGIILTLFLPVLGWVAFNMLGPVKNQLDAMAAKKAGGSKRR